MEDNETKTSTTDGGSEEQKEQQKTTSASDTNDKDAATDATGDTKSAAQDGETDAQSTTPPVTTFTKEELEERLNSVKHGYEGTIQKMREDLKQAEEAAARAQLEAEEDSYNKFIGEVEKSGGDVNMAKTMVTMQRELNARERELQKMESTMVERLVSVNELAKAEKASKLMKELGLPEASRDELLNSKSPVDMETKALRLALQKQAQASTPTRKTDSSVKTGKSGRDLSTMPDTEKMGYALEVVEQQQQNT